MKFIPVEVDRKASGLILAAAHLFSNCWLTSIDHVGAWSRSRPAEVFPVRFIFLSVEDAYYSLLDRIIGNRRERTNDHSHINNRCDNSDYFTLAALAITTS